MSPPAPAPTIFTTKSGIKYRIIPTTEEYIEPVLEIGGRAFKDDLLHAAIFPERLFNPDDPDEKHRFRAKMYKARLAMKGAAFRIAITEDEERRVLGLSGWFEPGMDGMNRMLGLPANDNLGVDGVRGNEEPKNGSEDGKMEKEKGGGWMDDGQGGKRGDGKNFPTCMDVGEQLRVKKILEEAKKELLGDEENNVWYLASLGVDPDFAGQGIASNLVQWGIDRAGEQGVSVYTESTPAGAVVYKKLGFVKLKDVKVLEGDIDHSVTAFIKRPKHQKP